MTMDQIRIDNLEVYAHHGVFQEEKEKGQYFYVNAVLYTETRQAGLSDDLNFSTNYSEVCDFIVNEMQKNIYDLIESVAENLATQILLNFDRISQVDLEIKKPHAPMQLTFESVSVRISRSWHYVYLSLGSNMGDRRSFLKQGIDGLNSHEQIQLLQTADVLETAPYGNVEQDAFLNTAVQIRTLMTPKELLDYIHELESKAERVREIHWGPRTLDIDIVFYDKLIYEDSELIVPHVDMENREFVLKPLSQIAPNFRHPILGKTITQLLNELTK